MAKVEFLFDVGSPNAYLAHRVIPGIEARTGAKFVYVPILLGGVFKATGNQSPMQAFGGIKNKLDYEMLETRRFVAKYKLTRYTMNPFFPVNTLMMMRMAAAAELEGTLAPYAEAAFHHMWEEPKKMDDPAVLRAAFESSGIGAERLMARAGEQAVKDKLIANTEAAVARGAFGAPSFFVGDDIFFGKDRLRDVEEAILAAG